MGFKLKAVKNGKSYKVKSHVSDKAMKRAKEKLKSLVKKIQRPETGKEQLAIQNFNVTVWGYHNYFQWATCVATDCVKLSLAIDRSLQVRLGEALKKKGTPFGYIKLKYGKSKQLRYLNGNAITPVGYVQAGKPMYKKQNVNSYTPEGRKEIHKGLGVNMEILRRLAANPVIGRSVEYCDNRISLYAAQYGKCAITRKPLQFDEIHCHHIVPVHHGGTDVYRNLKIVHVDVHRLIHATNAETIQKYLDSMKLSPTEISKINCLREQASLEPIAA